MLRNFQVGQSNELVTDGRVIDLHNEYDFLELTFRSDCDVRLTFIPNLEYGKGKATVVLDFSDVNFLELSVGFGTRPIRDLEEVGFMKEEQSDDAWLLNEGQATASDHLYFRMDADYIRIRSRKACLRGNGLLPRAAN